MDLPERAPDHCHSGVCRLNATPATVMVYDPEQPSWWPMCEDCYHVSWLDCPAIRIRPLDPLFVPDPLHLERFAHDHLVAVTLGNPAG